MRLHQHLIAAAVDALGRIFRDGIAADRAVESTLRQHPKWGSRDRRLVAAHIYDLVRWRRWYAWLADVEDADLSAAALWKTWAAYWMESTAGELPDFPECAGITAEGIAARKALEVPPAVRASFPDWLYETGMAEMGEAWPGIVASLNETAPVFLRANTLRTTVSSLISILKSEDIEATAVPDHPGALRLEKRVNFSGCDAYRTGLFEVQDAASQLIAPMVGAAPGMLVIDGCAGAGGKSLHLAALMNNEGRIIAQDVRPASLETLRDRALRAGASIIRTEHITGPDVLAKRAGTADRLLLDAPCSGLGVLRRNPDAKWRLTPAELERVTTLQREILQNSPVMLKPGGCMVFATCSILPRENGHQVREFLAGQRGAWTLEDEQTLMPGPHGDGFYAARLLKM